MHPAISLDIYDYTKIINTLFKVLEEVRLQNKFTVLFIKEWSLFNNRPIPKHSGMIQYFYSPSLVLGNDNKQYIIYSFVIGTIV